MEFQLWVLMENVHFLTHPLLMIKKNSIDFLENLPFETLSDLNQIVFRYDCQNVTRSGIRKLRNKLPQIKVHAYFAPSTPPATGASGTTRSRYCPCCALL